MRHLKRNVVLLDTDDELWLEYFDVRILVTARHIPKGGYDVPEIVAYCPDDRSIRVEASYFADADRPDPGTEQIRPQPSAIYFTRPETHSS